MDKSKTAIALANHRDKLAAREKTIKNLQWSGKLSKEEKQVLYHATKAYGLDPAQREVVCLGGNLYITVAGMVRIAERSGDYAGCKFYPVEGDKEGEIKYKCVVTKLVQGNLCEFEGLGRAGGLQDKNPTVSKYPEEMAQTRALGRALRRAWPISIPALEETFDDYTDAEATIIDEETGEVE
jgi:hypothetical protein